MARVAGPERQGGAPEVVPVFQDHDDDLGLVKRHALLREERDGVVEGRGGGERVESRLDPEEIDGAAGCGVCDVHFGARVEAGREVHGFRAPWPIDPPNVHQASVRGVPLVRWHLMAVNSLSSVV